MSGRIFINYRRGDEPGFAGRLFDRLEQAFAPHQLFMDVDNIPAGHDFVRVLEDEVGQCDVLLAIIGKGWIDARDEVGNRRLDQATDFVRIEIESALKLGKRVIPVLVNTVNMPRPDELPETLRPLARRNAVRLTHERFKADAQGLIKVLEGALQEAEAALIARSESERRAAEEALKRKQDEEVARATEAERNAADRVRQQASAGLSADEIRKAEELANWDFIKQKSIPEELRNHLARFPGGVTERYARTALEDLVWTGLGSKPTLPELEAFIDEFPTGLHTAVAKTLRDTEMREAKLRRDAEALAQKETQAWASTMADGNAAALQKFLEDWPKSIYSSQARQQLKRIAKAENSPRNAKIFSIASLTAIGLVAAWLLVHEYYNPAAGPARSKVAEKTQPVQLDRVARATEKETELSNRTEAYQKLREELNIDPTTIFTGSWATDSSLCQEGWLRSLERLVIFNDPSRINRHIDPNMTREQKLKWQQKMLYVVDTRGRYDDQTAAVYICTDPKITKESLNGSGVVFSASCSRGNGTLSEKLELTTSDGALVGSGPDYAQVKLMKCR